MKKSINLSNLIRPELLELKAYSSARDEFSTKESMIFLDANENPYETELNRYPDPYQTELKSKIAELKKIDTDHIMLGNGSDEVIDLLVRLFCQPYRDNILIFPPTYGMYKVVADLNAVNVKTVDLTEDFQIDINKTIASIDAQTKLIFVCSPNNPSGNSMNRKSILRLLDQFDGLVVVDEAYQDFSQNTSFIEELKEYENLVVMQTFSKAMGLAGSRLGMCFANPKIIKYLNRIKPPYNVNNLTQNIAFETLNNYSKVQKQIEQLLKEKAQLAIALEQIQWVKKVYPSESNFLLVKVDDANKRYNELLEQKIVVRNRHNQPGCENCLRFSIGTPTENKILINTLNQLSN
jgi:histidinol-phosphate aminotransferase